MVDIRKKQSENTRSYFSKLPDKTIVNVFLDDPVFDFTWDSIGKRFSHIPIWQQRVKQLTDGFCFARMDPIHYCKEHGNFDDGSHRLSAAKAAGITCVPVVVDSVCWKKRHTRISPRPFSEAVAELGTNNKTDAGWVHGCHSKKWFLFGPQIPWEGKTVLDIGCQVGYTCYQACHRGAEKAVGWDNRASVVAVAEHMRSKFPTAKVSFHVGDFLDDAAEPPRSDVVLCMGCPHYFPPNLYNHGMNKLFDLSKEWVVLELRHSKTEGRDPLPRARQTLATDTWLLNKAKTRGFKKWDMWQWPGNQNDDRKLWIFRKGAP